MAEFSDREFTWRRLAVEPEHFEEFNIIALAPKKKDCRYRAFVGEWGERCAEVEAIPAPALREMVRDAIEDHIPQGEWQRLKTIEAAEKESWDEAMDLLESA